MTPRRGELYWDLDNRVTSRWVVVRDVLDDGRILIGRGRDGQGRKSRVSPETLRRRFIRQADSSLPEQLKDVKAERDELREEVERLREKIEELEGDLMNAHEYFDS